MKKFDFFNGKKILTCQEKCFVQVNEKRNDVISKLKNQTIFLDTKQNYFFRIIEKGEQDWNICTGDTFYLEDAFTSRTRASIHNDFFSQPHFVQVTEENFDTHVKIFTRFVFPDNDEIISCSAVSNYNKDGISGRVFYEYESPLFKHLPLATSTHGEYWPFDFD